MNSVKTVYNKSEATMQGTLLTTETKSMVPNKQSVIMTGMGSDGTIGMQAVRDTGGITLAEDESTCVVSGMPRSAFLRGSVSHYLPLHQIIDIFHA